MTRATPGPLTAALVRVPAVVLAVTLFAIPVLTAPLKPIVVIGAIALALAAVGIAGLWRWAITASACMLLVAYAAALLVADAPISLPRAAAAGLSVLLLLQSVEAGRWLRRAAFDAAVIRSQALFWLGTVAAIFAVTALVTRLAGPIVALIPFSIAPFVAAASALVVGLALAAAMRAHPRRSTPSRAE